MAKVSAGWQGRQHFKSGHSGLSVVKPSPFSSGRGGGEMEPSYSQG
jgi:hypothetical protein